MWARRFYYKVGQRSIWLEGHSLSSFFAKKARTKRRNHVFWRTESRSAALLLAGFVQLSAIAMTLRLLAML
jgi:hypothetical protein